jgi:hypothetical protein
MVASTLFFNSKKLGRKILERETGKKKVSVKPCFGLLGKVWSKYSLVGLGQPQPSLYLKVGET